MKILSKIKYPKFILLILTFVLAYFLFANRDFEPFHKFLMSLGYAGIFISGMMFAYGFTSGPATALLLIFGKEYNFLIAGLIAGLGAMFSDLVLFKFIRVSFKDEIDKFKKEKIVGRLNNKLPKLIKKYLVPVIAGFVIASPLPDEIGVSLFASSYNIKTRIFIVISYILNTAGAILILAIGSVL